MISKVADVPIEEVAEAEAAVPLDVPVPAPLEPSVYGRVGHRTSRQHVELTKLMRAVKGSQQPSASEVVQRPEVVQPPEAISHEWHLAAAYSSRLYNYKFSGAI